ncbi:MAG: hypothetical protein JKX85_15640 [Phycisphaeraceae bacterium]|nr:hypothetical protein [Phycisphaeraceae bacterium]
MPFNESGGGGIDLTAIDTLAELNANLTDATLDDAASPRTPTAHNQLLATITDAGTAAAANTGTGVGNVPVLDAGGQLNTTTIPALALVNTSTVASEVAMLALVAQSGDVAIRTDINKSFILAGTSTILADWKEILSPDSVTSVAGKTGIVTLAAVDITDAGTAATKDVGVLNGNVVQLDATGLPAVDGSQLTGMSPGVTDYNLLSNRPYVPVPVTGVSANLAPSGFLAAGSSVITGTNSAMFGWYKINVTGNAWLYSAGNSAPYDGVFLNFISSTYRINIDTYLLNSGINISNIGWTHLGYTLETDNTCTLWKDGIAVATGISTGTIGTITGTKIGRRFDNNTQSNFEASHIAEWQGSVPTVFEIAQMAGGTAPDAIATVPTRYYGDLSAAGGYVPTIGTGTFATAGSVTDASTDPAVTAKDYIDGDATTELATAGQGVLADSATQPGDLGTAAPLNVPAAGNAAAGEVVKGDDTRVTGALQTITYAANIAPDVSLGRNFICTLTGNVTLDAPTGGVAGDPITLTLVQDATGSRLLTVSANIKTPTQSIFAILSTGANVRDVLMLIKDPTGGNNWYITNMKTGFS